MNPNEICFITAVNDIARYNKSLATWNALTVPKGFSVNSLVVQDAESMTSAYQEAMETSSAKYKIYIHQDVEILQQDFLYKMVDVFQKNPVIGITGMVGSVNIPLSAVWWDGELVGAIRDDHTGEMFNYLYRRNSCKPIEVALIDGLLLMTQYDVNWRTDIFDKWHFYDLSQCMEFHRQGYKAAVLPQIMPMTAHYCGQNPMSGYEEERVKFIEEYGLYIKSAGLA